MNRKKAQQYFSMDVIVTLLFLLFGIFWLLKAYEIKSGYTSRVATNVPFTGPYTFPMIIGWLIVVSALVNLYISFSAGRKAIRNAAETAENSANQAELKDGDSSKEKWYDLLRVCALLITATAYVLLLKPVGFIPCTIVLVFVSLLLFGLKNRIILVVISIAAPVILWFLFKVLIKVQLP